MSESIAAFHKQVNALMRSKSYVYKNRKESALEHRFFTHPKTNLRITISGWHGTGRYGSIKTVFSLNARDTSTGNELRRIEELSVENHHVDLDNNRLTPAGVEAMERGMKKMLDYIKSL